MMWLQITYYTREGAIGAVRCSEAGLVATKRGIISGHSEILAVKEVITDAVPTV